jgi:hypothetical protein
VPYITGVETTGTPNGDKKMTSEIKIGMRVKFLSKKDIRVYGKFGTVKDQFATSIPMFGVIPDSMPTATVDTAGKRLAPIEK